MATEILLEREGYVKTGLVGFSWTYFFFGFWVPLFRGDYKTTIIIFLVSILLGITTYGAGIGLMNLIIAFFYNKYYTENLIRVGFRPMDEFSKSMLNEYDIYY